MQHSNGPIAAERQTSTQQQLERAQRGLDQLDTALSDLRAAVKPALVDTQAVDVSASEARQRGEVLRAGRCEVAQLIESIANRIEAARDLVLELRARCDI